MSSLLSSVLGCCHSDCLAPFPLAAGLSWRRSASGSSFVAVLASHERREACTCLGRDYMRTKKGLLVSVCI
eukprot:3747868-Alexandrium_andersonii.AAC.1